MKSIIFLMVITLSMPSWSGYLDLSQIDSYKTSSSHCAESYVKGKLIRRDIKGDLTMCLNFNSLGDKYTTHFNNCALGYIRGKQSYDPKDKDYDVLKCLKLASLGSKYITSSTECISGYIQGKRTQRFNNYDIQTCFKVDSVDRYETSSDYYEEGFSKGKVKFDRFNGDYKILTCIKH